MEHTILKPEPVRQRPDGAGGECQTSRQSACKTSRGIANQSRESAKESK